jgi:hypothetical protein
VTIVTAAIVVLSLPSRIPRFCPLTKTHTRVLWQEKRPSIDLRVRNVCNPCCLRKTSS